MKKIISVFSLYLVLVLLVVGGSINVNAVSPVDTNKAASLTLYYKYGDNVFKDIEIKSYRVAEAFEDGTYSLCGEFKDYPVNIYGVTSNLKWREIASTLAAYVAADGIEPTCSSVTDSTGKVAFENIASGMYLTLAVKAEAADGVTVFESFLTAVPAISEDGNHNYNVTAYPKCEMYIPTLKETEYKVLKQWKDNAFTKKRPQFIEVDIIKDGAVQYTEKLSSENNWSYSWKAVDDGSEWQAVERNVPKDYTVTVVGKGNTVIITNAYDYGYKEPPKTGETIAVWPLLLIMCLSGGIALLIAVWSKGREK